MDYEALVDLLLRAKFRWLLCGYLHAVLHRLGEPIWAQDVQLLCVRVEQGQEDRTECLWSNFSPQIGTRCSVPATLRSKLRVLADASSLSFTALDSKIDEGLETVAKDWSSLCRICWR